MSISNRRFFSGNTLEQALVQAAGAFDLHPSEVAYKVVEKRHGFLKTPRRAVIEVDATAPRKPEDEIPSKDEGVRLPPSPNAATLAGAERVTPGPSGGSDPAEVELVEAPEGPPQMETENLSGRDAAGPPPASRDEDAEREGEEARRAPADAPRPWEAPMPEDRAEELPEERDAAPQEDVRADDQDHEAEAQGRDADDGGHEAGAQEREAGDRRRGSRPRGRRSRRGGRGRSRRGDQERREAPARELVPATGPQAEAAETAVGELVRLMGLELESKVFQGDKRLEIRLEGGGSKSLLRGEGRALFAMEHLLPKMIHTLCEEWVYVRVDCNGFKENREGELRDRALRMAKGVIDSGKPKSLEPLNPAERRVVHLALVEDPRVDTKSGGSGYLKRVTIRPA